MLAESISINPVPSKFPLYATSKGNLNVTGNLVTQCKFPFTVYQLKVPTSEHRRTFDYVPCTSKILDWL